MNIQDIFRFIDNSHFRSLLIKRGVLSVLRIAFFPNTLEVAESAAFFFAPMVVESPSFPKDSAKNDHILPIS